MGERNRGKKRGPNKATIIRELLLSKDQTLEIFAKGSQELQLPSRLERLAKLIREAPPPVIAALERDLMLHEWGRPKETVAFTGQIDIASAIGAAFLAARGAGRVEEPKPAPDAIEEAIALPDVKNEGDPT